MESTSILDFDYDWLHNKAICHSPASLYQLSTLKITINLWYEEETLDILEGIKLKIAHYVVEERLLKKMHNKVSLLPFPNKLKNAVGKMIELTRKQLSSFLGGFMPDKFVQQNRWPLLKNVIRWTSQGTIDTLTTAKALADAEDLDIEIRFEIALVFFLEDRVNALYVYISPNYFKENKKYLPNIVAMDDNLLAKCHFGLQRYAPVHDNIFDELFIYENYLGVFYCWQHFSQQFKNRFLNSFDIQDLTIDCNSSVCFFTLCDKEKKLQLLQNEDCCSMILHNLIGTQWLPMFFKYKEEMKIFLTANLAVEILEHCLRNLETTVAHKKEYIEICNFFFEFVFLQECSRNALTCKSNALVMRAMGMLTEEGEREKVKFCLESVNSEWLKKQFTSCSAELAYLIAASLRCGLLDFVLNSALPTIEDRKHFLSKEEIYSIITEFILSCHQMDDADRTFNSLFSNTEEIRNFKVKFVKKSAKNICYRFLKKGNWMITAEFVQWCFVSNEKINRFYKNFFQSQHFEKLFELDCLEKSSTAIASLIKENSLECLLSSNDIVSFNDFFMMLYRSDSDHLSRSETFYKALDTFLAALNKDDQKTLLDLKTELATDDKLKAYITCPINLLQKETRLVNKFYWREKENLSDQSVRQMVHDFFCWLCPSDEKLKSKLEEKFWSQKLAKDAKRRLKSAIQKKAKIEEQCASPIDSDDESLYEKVLLMDYN